MTTVEYYRFENEVLMRTTGANIHDVKNKLNGLKGAVLGKERHPEKSDFFNNYIADLQMEIHRVVYN